MTNFGLTSGTPINLENEGAVAPFYVLLAQHCTPLDCASSSIFRISLGPRGQTPTDHEVLAYPSVIPGNGTSPTGSRNNPKISPSSYLEFIGNL